MCNPLSRFAVRYLLPITLLLCGPAALAAGDRSSTGSATIYVIQSGTGYFVNALIYLDGKYLDKLSPNTYLPLTVVPGAHEISTAGISRVALPLNAQAGEVYYIQPTTKADGNTQFTILSGTEGQRLLAQTRPIREMLHTTITPPQPRTEQRDDSDVTRFGPDSGAYLGLSGGSTRAKGVTDYALAGLPDFQAYIDLTFFPSIPATSSGSDSDTAEKLFVGFRFNRYLSVEGAYVNLGTYTAKLHATDGTDTVSLDGTWKFNGLSAAAVGSLPLGSHFALSAKLGGLYWKNKYDEVLTDTTLIPATDSASVTNHGFSPLLGIGVTVNLTKWLALRAEYERYWKVGKTDTGKFDIDSFSAGVVFLF